MKKIFFSIIVFFFLMLTVGAVDLNITSSKVFLYSLDEDTVIYEKNADIKAPIASLTKIMTAIVAFEHINSLSDTVIITAEDLQGLKEQDATVAGFYVGEQLTYEDLLYALLLPSGADAAQALTRNLAGGRTSFINLMNEKALELGLKNTHFANETGLDAPNHYSTAREVATILKYALQYPELKKIMQTPSYTTSDNYKKLSSTVFVSRGLNSLKMDYLLGGKTGSTSKAGLCLASFASYQGKNYLLVNLGAAQGAYHLKDAKVIYDYFYNISSSTDTTVNFNLTLKTTSAKEQEITFNLTSWLTKYLPANYDRSQVSYVYNGINPVLYSFPKGSKLGEVLVYYQHKYQGSFNLYLDRDLHYDNQSADEPSTPQINNDNSNSSNNSNNSANLLNNEPNNSPESSNNNVNKQNDNQSKQNNSENCDFNCDLTGDGECNLNCDINNDNICDKNCDTNNDGTADLNIDFTGDNLCNLNCDTNNDGLPDKYVDTDNDNICNLNCDLEPEEAKMNNNLTEEETNSCTDNCGSPSIKEAPSSKKSFSFFKYWYIIALICIVGIIYLLFLEKRGKNLNAPQKIEK